MANTDLSAQHPHLYGCMTPSPDSNGNTIHTIKGRWKFEKLNLPEREFQLVQTVSPVSQLPIDGIYHGSFYLAGETVQEHHVEITFTDRGDRYNIKGGGRNKFGEFKLIGTAVKLRGDKYSVEMYKIYESIDHFREFQRVKQEYYENQGLTNSDEREMTRVDGKGLWRNWKRNFNSQRTAILDLVDNSLDASISGQHAGFVGHCHIDTDTYKNSKMRNPTVTGITIINNCISKLPSLKTCLQVYDSSKVDSGAAHVGENGVGLKQACATLSDRSFVLVKNGSNSACELGIIAEDLQSTDGVYLPAFQFSNNHKGNPSLTRQMKDVFSQPEHADVAQTIAEYGAALNEHDPDLEVGIDRLCKLFDKICYEDKAFANSPYVFAVVVDKVRSKNVDAITRVRVNTLLDELTCTISRTYLHVPRTFDFMIKDRSIDFAYWQRRLVEFSKMEVNVGTTIEWTKWGREEDHRTFSFRVFCGFDSQEVMERDGEKIGALYVYSRQSGRLITFHKDARTLLGLTAGGTEFCSGLRIILDDIGGHLPLNPTKQDVAFSEMLNGEIFRENLWRSVGAAAHCYYKFHIKKYGDRKKDLSKHIAIFGEHMATERKLDRELAHLNLTTFELGTFKVNKHNLRVEGREEIGSDTIYRLLPRQSEGPKSKRGGCIKRKASDDDKTAGILSPLRRQPIRKKKVQQPQVNDSGAKLNDVHERTAEQRMPFEDDYDDDLFSSSENEDMTKEHSEDEDAAVISFLPHRPQRHAHAAKPSLQCGQSSVARVAEDDLEIDVSQSALKNAPKPATFDGLFGDDDDDVETDSLKQKLAQKDELLKALTIKLEERNKTVLDLRKTVQDKEKEIAELKEQLYMICRSEATSDSIL